MSASVFHSSVGTLAGQQLGKPIVQQNENTEALRFEPKCVATGRDNRRSGESGESHRTRGLVGSRSLSVSPGESVPWLLNSSKDAAPAKNQWLGQLFQFSSDPWSGLVAEAVKTNLGGPVTKLRQGDAAALSRQYDTIPATFAPKKVAASPSAGQSSNRTSIRSQDWRAVRFTADKAEKLRKQLKQTDTWHDTMYHSGIAAMLADRES